MNFISGIIELVLEIYFWLIIIKYVLLNVGVEKNNNFTTFLDKATMPYLSFIKKLSFRGFDVFAPIIALLLIYWAKLFIPTFFAGPLSGSISQLLQTFWETVKVGLFFLAIESIVYFFLRLLETSIDNKATIFIRDTLQPFLTPLKKILPETKIDIAPVVLFIILAIILNFA